MHFRNNYDIIVVGAGIAGISAAVKCGKENVKVLLIESYPFLGGMSSAGMVSPFMKHEVNGEILVRGIFEDIEDEMRSMNGMIDNGFYASAFRSSAFNLLSRNNVDIILNASLIGVETNNKFIESVRIVHENKIMNISGKVFIDTTGDAQIIFLAGLPFQKGDEQTGKLQAMTLFFRIGNIDLLQTLKYVKQNKDDFLPWMEFEFDLSKIISVAGFFSNVKKAIAENRLNSDINYIFFTTLPESGEASFNTSNILSLDGSSSFDLTKAELIGRKQVNQVYKILKNEIPGFHNSVLLETAAQVGVRETRRAIGDYIITGDDIRSGKKFNDSVARGCYGIDIHGQKDEDDRMEDLPEGEFYEIPLRSLIVKNIKNLLVAGRCISSTREAHGALRIQPTSAATGEACGAIASVAIKSNLEIRDVNYLEVQKLIKHNIGSK